MPVLEPERRKNHIDMIDRIHALLPIAMDCLHYQENERPSSEELCQRLAGLKEAMEYRESVQQVKWLQIDRDELERQIGEMQVRESANTNEIQRQREEIQSKDVQYQQQERHLLGKIESQQRHLQQLYQQLEEQEQVTAEIQHCLLYTSPSPRDATLSRMPSSA